MFGIIVAGRPINVSPYSGGEGKFVFLLEDAANIGHMTVFLLPNTPIPNDYGGAIYLAYPPYQSWKCLGYLSSQKQSAIFRLTMPPNLLATTTASDIEMKPEPVVAQLGISIESLSSIQQQLNSNIDSSFVNTSSSGVGGLFGKSGTNNNNNNNASSLMSDSSQDSIRVAHKILQNLSNYAMSFAKPVFSETIPGQPPQKIEVIPLQAFLQWFKTTESRLQKDPSFFKQ